MKNVLVFDIGGAYAHFRKPFSTTSPLTYGVPTRTALMGLIAAILGLERGSYYEMLGPGAMDISLALQKPINKQTINLNLLKTKDATEGLIDLRKNPPYSIERIQIPFEMVKEPLYRVFLKFSDDNLSSKFERHLAEHLAVYTPYLGISECIADFSFLGAYPARKITGSVEIDSVVPRKQVQIKVQPGRRYEREKIPMGMEKERTVTDYKEWIYDSKGKTLSVIDTEYWEVGEWNVVFF